MKIEQGDTVLLGQHRLYCGNSLELTSVWKALNEKKASMLFTDPPCMIEYAPAKTYRGAVCHRASTFEQIQGDDKSFDYAQFLKIVSSGIIEGATYICATNSNFNQLWEWSNKTFERQPVVIIWIKDNFVIGMRDYHSNYELVFYNYFKEKKWRGGKNQTDTWRIAKPDVNKYLHPTQKPIELAKRAIENSSDKGDIVLDLFAGSGTTLIASELTGRRCAAIEISASFCETIVKRWENLSGEKAVKLK